ncbi:DNA-binding transcriptional regulator, LysR family [Amycolatopsis pretoriensis]|uniref:DNA-binding transcriptional regulator, LysR family n=1 Tax=Amycolatopsis pretoriensis TaxID=218821 RepID=A0A1H5QFL9_9PSEU|nr:LysR family transcriptional regulator [Amycolatopsis pretoriensis]SEF24181.1 DNA-binding transcriptional regulator, LysR family [Amycolatopsis pretoriensis]
MQIDPRRLAVLLAVHRAGGVLAAGDLLHLTPSAVSQQIARLEETIGVAVLDRQPTGAVLTPAGRVLAEAAEHIEAELIDARKALAALAEDVTGTVVIAAFQSVIRTLLIPLLRQLREQFPALEVVIREMETRKALQSLRSGAVDLLILEAESPASQGKPARGTRDVPVLEEPWLVVLPTGMADPVSTADLEHHTWLGVDSETAAHAATERTRGGTPAPGHSYYDYNVALSMVAGGLGIALVPALAVREAVPDGVKAVSLPGLGTRTLVARHRTTRSEPRKEVVTVLDAIVTLAAGLDVALPWTVEPPHGG